MIRDERDLSPADASPRLGALRRVDLNLFIVLEAIFSEGTLTAAGMRLGLTQPAISHALARLRAALQDPLFVRQGSRIHPTPYARSIIPDVRRALLLLEGRAHDAKSFDPTASTVTFRIMTDEGTEAFLLPRLLAKFSAVAPSMTAVSIAMERNGTEAPLASGAIDLVLTGPMPNGVSIRRRVLAADQLIVLTREGHPKTVGAMDASVYLALDHILVARDQYAVGPEDHELHRAGLRRIVIARCQNYVTACDVVAQTDMAVTMSRLHAVRLIAGRPITVHRFPMDAPSLDITMYWHASLQTDAANVWLRQTVAAIFEDFSG